MTNQPPFATSPSHVEEAAREERHKVLIDLLGGYVDGELTPEIAAQIDAHLIGCSRCRGEVAIQQSLRGKLREIPTQSASLALRERINAAISAAPAPRPYVDESARRSTSYAKRWIIGAVCLVAASVGGYSVYRGSETAAPTQSARQLSVAASTIPLFDAILADYSNLAKIDLPGRARDLATVRAAVPFDVRPIEAPHLRLLGAWTADLRGEPAAVLAYRLDDRLVVQYVVSDQVFFRNPVTREAVSGGHMVAASGTASKIVAWPEENAATVLVGSVPFGTLESLRAGQRSK
jgi:anti-sigma factor RsiW